MDTVPVLQFLEGHKKPSEKKFHKLVNETAYIKKNGAIMFRVCFPDMNNGSKICVELTEAELEQVFNAFFN